MIEFPIFPVEEYLEEMMNLAFIEEMDNQNGTETDEFI